MLLGALLLGGCYKKGDLVQAVYPLPGGNAEMVLERVQTHPVLAEFQHRVVLRRGGRVVDALELGVAGPFVPIRVYGVGKAGYRVVRGYAMIQVEPKSLTLRPGAYIPSVMENEGVLLGAFEKTQAGKVVFVSAPSPPPNPLDSSR
ncbi:MAG: hypothetical protein OEW12_03870 [Deltaproteobacteria bacterium]|nr:hypothetical protein [Deltaproteobacteria bacterium]